MPWKSLRVGGQRYFEWTSHQFPVARCAVLAFADRGQFSVPTHGVAHGWDPHDGHDVPQPHSREVIESQCAHRPRGVADAVTPRIAETSRVGSLTNPDPVEDDTENAAIGIQSFR